MAISVIADIIGSRALPDRGAAQRTLEDVIARVDHDLPLAREALRPTVGDELQGVYARLDDALAALLLLRLALPDGLECRFGVGVGSIRTVPSEGGAIPDGPGWWAAREAVELVHAKQQRQAPAARTWVVAAADEDAATHARVPLANAYLLARDHLVGAMTERTRRLVYGRCLGRTQRELADAEGITQSAVSQALAAAGAAAIVEGYDAILAEVPA
ncbi:SatD family protein [Microbacterium sp. LRZ72]|uniref:SatD family protein n=1 Tax=Microbacterium sp. LRZ72 TaxID=2942481 RepID=UPI0029B5E69C|nr:SatD family protein [Microbacterium sp. LRZ72]MDX2375693.1 SatD family protein [Microbacterium sp. LRZ72]